MHARLIVSVVSMLVMGCTTAPKSDQTPVPDPTPERNYNAPSLTVDLTSNGSQVLASVPVESTLERFEMIDPQGRIISYVAFTDTHVGGLVFVDQKLRGTLSHHQAQAFYSCRGYATTAPNHWAHEAADWVASLLASSKPVTSVKLEFFGKSTVQSVREVAGSPLLKQMKSLLNMGTNLLSIFGSLDTARSDLDARNQFDKAVQGLSLIRPGASEFDVAQVVKPEDVSFVIGGMVMAYPSHLVEYFVTEGVVKVIQQPSFHYLSRTRAAQFYTPRTQWKLCTPLHWKEALPETP